SVRGWSGRKPPGPSTTTPKVNAGARDEVPSESCGEAASKLLTLWLRKHARGSAAVSQPIVLANASRSGATSVAVRVLTPPTVVDVQPVLSLMALAKSPWSPGDATW